MDKKLSFSCLAPDVEVVTIPLNWASRLRQMSKIPQLAMSRIGNN